MKLYKMSELNVMIVEDELITAEAIAVLLKKLNYHPIAIVSSGEEAISKIEELDLDLILMDIILSGTMDGIEAAKIIHEHYNIPIIFITAYGDKATLNRAKLSEPYGYIVKPITSEADILPTIELAMYNHQVKKKLKKDKKKFEQIKRLIQTEKGDLPSQNYNSEDMILNIEPSPMKKAQITDQDELIKLLKIFSNPERFLILDVLKSHPLNLDDVEELIGKSQSTSSHHINKLEEMGFIQGWKRGKYIYYTLNKSHITEFAQRWETCLRYFSS